MQIQHFNPIIVLFLTDDVLLENGYAVQFQSYYSLIFNQVIIFHDYFIMCNFNPIIVLFLTLYDAVDLR